jgi:hypothetical protein
VPAISAGEFGYAKPYTYGLIVCRLLIASIEIVTAVEAVAAFTPLAVVALGPVIGNPVVATRLAATSACGVAIAPGVSARPAPDDPEPTKANRATEIKAVVKP